MKKASAISRAFEKDARQTKAIKQLAKTGRSRDFWRWVRLPWPQYITKLPLRSKGTRDKQVVEEDVGMNLPSDFLAIMKAKNTFNVNIFGPNGRDSLREYWEAEDQSYLRRVGLTEAQYDTCVPLFWHEDSVPSFKEESFAFWSWGSLSQLGAFESKVAVVGLPASRVLPATRRAIMKVIKWDLETLLTGLCCRKHVGLCCKASYDIMFWIVCSEESILTPITTAIHGSLIRCGRAKLVPW